MSERYRELIEKLDAAHFNIAKGYELLGVTYAVTALKGYLADEETFPSGVLRPVEILESALLDLNQGA